MTKTAIVLFNLGGPDRPDSVRPFLFNLFNDPAIIGLPNPLRYLVAKLISGRRAPVAAEIYQHLGGGSPLLPNTVAQADALTDALSDLGEVKSFIAMRYWHPMTEETVRAVLDYAPDQVVLLPLYPQFSTTTTASSLKKWREEATKVGLSAPTHIVGCYPRADGYIRSVAQLTKAAMAQITAGKPRILFSAHGLPKKVVEKGDPYQWQVEQSAARVVAAMDVPDLDWVVCYQSRVGPLEWIGPSTDQEIRRAGQDGVPLVVCPIAFVSEHSETLVEIELEYRHLAEESGVPAFIRVPTPGDDPLFIESLAKSVRDVLARPAGIWSDEGNKLCPAQFGRCMCQAG
ncbi:ferrochelatase [Oceanibaculum pacificum]|uniref:Ferrochelatase n=1 Tax=Oceanibaculum pacificum TaxID=580166 RepID=A0A154WH60_9PROT|nr:ferrochelatase [Oceanibaculum pacificum]KZD12826.1 ferrochelatase [Oceanibaculum pacificum]